jgi:hypothetical protein
MLFQYTLYFSLFERIFSTNQYPLVFYLIITIYLFYYNICVKGSGIRSLRSLCRFKHIIFFFIQEDIVVIGKTLRICGILIYRCLTNIKPFILVCLIFYKSISSRITINLFYCNVCVKGFGIQ